jgi:hypothetical protein
MDNPEFIITTQTGIDLLNWSKGGVDHEAELKKCISIDLLGSYYKSMSSFNQVKYRDLTNELKKKLTTKSE